jgi:membrane protein implicated in regulation of membrane protease activity
MLIEGLGLSWLPMLVLGLLGIVFIGLCAWGLVKVLEVLDKPSSGPKQKLINQLGRVLTPVGENQRGKVLVMGEIWNALSSDRLGDTLIPKDMEIRVTGFDAIDPQVLRVTTQLELLDPSIVDVS